MVKLKANIDRAQLKRIIEKKQKLLQENIAAVIRNEAIPHLIDRIMEGFDSLADRADQLPEDPTNPSNWRDEFRTKLQEDLQNTFRISGNRIQIDIGEKRFLGYAEGGENESSDSTPLVWLVYYIEGLAGDWAFIGPDLYERFRGSGTFDETWGRFGQGFMISKEQYFEEGWNNIVSYESVRHPFSGFSPVDIFNEALNEFRLRPFIQKAIDAATAGRKL